MKNNIINFEERKEKIKEKKYLKEEFKNKKITIKNTDNHSSELIDRLDKIINDSMKSLNNF